MKRNKFLKTLIALPFIAPLMSKASKAHPYSPNGTVFTEEMLHGNNYGLFIINTKAGTFEDIKKNPGYAATVSWKLGYSFGMVINTVNNERYAAKEWNKYNKVNFLTDGWSCPIGNTNEDVLNYLNNSKDKFRLMTKEEVIYLLTVKNQGFYE